MTGAVRVALVANVLDDGDALAAVVAAYLPRAYGVEHVAATGSIVITGRDVAGWTLDEYVIPRLASGCIWATEVDDPEAVRRFHVREAREAQGVLL